MKVLQWRPRKKDVGSDLNSLLKMAVDIRKKVQHNTGETVPDFKIFISGKIMDILISNRMIAVDSILCGQYVSKLLASLLQYVPEHWIAIDYLIQGNKNNPYVLQQGADMCFLVCSVFPKRLGRCMKINDYKTFGISLFMQYFQKTGEEIGFHMSKQFPDMVKVTQECINKI